MRRYNPNDHTRMMDVRRWAFYELGAQMQPRDLGVPHGPTQWLQAPEAITEASGHESMRLFAPAPVQMPGQLDMGSALDTTA